MNGRSVEVYSLANNGNDYLTPHIKVREMACKDGSDTVITNRKLLDILENIRVHFNNRLIVHSGYRNDAYNKKIGGANYSQHKYGMACDFHIENTSVKEVYKYARTLMKDFGGIGVYDSFIHIDVREKKTDWTNTKYD